MAHEINRVLILGGGFAGVYAALHLEKIMKATDLAGALHAYPTYSTAIQQLAADMTIENLLSGTSGRIIRGLSKIIR